MSNTTFTTYIYAVILPPDAQQWWEPAFSLSCLSFVPPFALPPFLLPASLQPSPLPLPRRSIVSAWFSSLSLSCSICSLAFAEQPEPNAAQRPVWAQGRGREALQTADPARKTRQYWLPSSSTGCANPNVRWHLLICFFKAEIHLSSPVSALVCRLTHIPWFTLGKQQIC